MIREQRFTSLTGRDQSRPPPRTLSNTSRVRADGIAHGTLLAFEYEAELSETMGTVKWHTDVVGYRWWRTVSSSNLLISVPIRAIRKKGDDCFLTDTVPRFSPLVFVYMSQYKQRNHILFSRKAVYRFATRCNGGCQGQMDPTCWRGGPRMNRERRPGVGRFHVGRSQLTVFNSTRLASLRP